jgi:hypothetical protein
MLLSIVFELIQITILYTSNNPRRSVCFIQTISVNMGGRGAGLACSSGEGGSWAGVIKGPGTCPGARHEVVVIYIAAIIPGKIMLLLLSDINKSG